MNDPDDETEIPDPKTVERDGFRKRLTFFSEKSVEP
jgi:hypothetical protein